MENGEQKKEVLGTGEKGHGQGGCHSMMCSVKGGGWHGRHSVMRIAIAVAIVILAFLAGTMVGDGHRGYDRGGHGSHDKFERSMGPGGRGAYDRGGYGDPRMMGGKQIPVAPSTGTTSTMGGMPAPQQ